LRGHGTIDGDVVSDGLVWPGGSVGVLTINGNYTQNADATLQIDVTPTQASELLVNGKASLAGGLSLVYAPGTYTAATYTLVQANALSGQFSTTVASGSVPTAFNPQVTYTSTQANLVLTTPPATPTGPATPTTVVAPHDSAIYANFMRSASLIGQQSLATVLGATLRPGDNGCAGADVTRTNTVTTSCTGGLWAQYSGGSDSLSGSNGLNSTSFGLQFGADRSIGEVVHVGVAAGLDRINGNDHDGGNGSIDNVHGGVYAFANTGSLVVSGLIDEAHGSYRVSRQTGIGFSTASPDGNTTAAGIQVAWPMAAAQWQITPTLGALYQHQSLDGFNETAVSVNPLASAFLVQGMHSTYNTLQPYASVSFVRPFVAQGISYVPQVSLGYRYDTRNANSPVVNTMAQDGTPFALQGDALGRGTTTVGARITAQAGASWNLYLDYQGQFANHLDDNALSVGFTKHF
jgi:fibronectin-binding autotransporter adhesin